MHELGRWYYMHTTKILSVSQLHIFTILALFSMFLTAPLPLCAFDLHASVAIKHHCILYSLPGAFPSPTL